MCYVNPTGFRLQKLLCSNCDYEMTQNDCIIFSLQPAMWPCEMLWLTELDYVCFQICLCCRVYESPIYSWKCGEFLTAHPTPGEIKLLLKSG